jgi:DNA polymerase-3 subunit gamma/tau
MLHQTLYRKYRPQKLEEIKGQEEVVTLFSNILKNKKLAHAYLFKGGRGTGKTSVARILARELDTDDIDIIEIDAASNRGIDEIRALKEDVQTLPFNSEYKVYIIDEAHMLTSQAANAFLKTLEEPPKHCIFILATTDAEKLPETILSRCQIINFKKPDLKTLEEIIISIAEKEGYQIDIEAAKLLAILSDGSFRDGQSHLEKVLGLVSKDKHVTLDLVEKIGGVPKTQSVLDLIDALVKADTEKVLKIIEDLNTEGADVKIFTFILIEKIRTALLLRFDNTHNFEKSLKNKIATDEIDFLSKIGKEKQNPLTSKTLILFIDTYNKMMRTGFPANILLEVAIMEHLEKEI